LIRFIQFFRKYLLLFKTAPSLILRCGAEKRRGALQEKDKREEAAAERQLHYGSWPGLQTPNKQSMRRAQSRPWPAAHSRFDASVGVHSQSLGHRHVGNPATSYFVTRWYVKPSLTSFYRVTVFEVQPTTGHRQSGSLYPARVSHPPVPSLAGMQVVLDDLHCGKRNVAQSSARNEIPEV
jgi:hypothetical protein